VTVSAIQIEAWWFVLTNGEWFAGIRGRDSWNQNQLSSLQKVMLGVVAIPVPTGPPRPKCTMASYPWLVDRLDIPEGAVWIRADAMPELEALKTMLANTEQIRIEQRAAKAGIVVASEESFRRRGLI
jgi:hypothetical protein